MVNKPIYLIASVLAILGIAAMMTAGSTSSVFAQGEEVEVKIVPGASTLGAKAFSPDPVQVKVGQKVKWENDDTAFHTVTSGSAGSADSGKMFDSGLTGPNALTTKGKTFEFTFTKAGEFPYYCQLHPTMVGKVVVQ